MKHSSSIDDLTKIINLHLHDLDRVINGLISTMPYFEFENTFNCLVTEISKKGNITRRNLDILWEYIYMSEALEYAYGIWDAENFESNPSYEVINSMYVEIYNSCNSKILRLLEIYDSEKLKMLSQEDESLITITPYIQNIEDNCSKWPKRFFGAISLKPGIAGMSIDIKKLFKK